MPASAAAALPVPVAVRRQALRFERQLPAYADPARLAAWLAEQGVPAAAGGHLLASARLQPRLAELLIERLALAPCPAEAFAADEARIALLEGADLARLIACCGAIWHGRRLRHVILGADLAALDGKVDAGLRRIALGCLDLAAEPEGELTIPELLAAIEQAGSACLDAFAQTLPPALGARLRLKLPPSAANADEAVAAALRERGAAVAARAAARLHADG